MGGGGDGKEKKGDFLVGEKASIPFMRGKGEKGGGGVGEVNLIFSP